MISADMRLYDYSTLGNRDAYGQPQLSEEIQGSIKMAINTINQSTEQSMRYKDATYIGLTMADISDAFVINYGEEKLKVLYVNPRGRYNQVFMTNL